MNIPNYVQDKLVDKNGNLTDGWRLTITQLLTELQNNAGNEGLVSPSQPSTNIAKLINSPNGSLVYDNTTHELKVNINGVFKIVTVS